MGNTNSFKIGIDYKYFQTLHNEEFWPEHVICRRFFLKKSYSQANQHQHNNDLMDIMGRDLCETTMVGVIQVDMITEELIIMETEIIRGISIKEIFKEVIIPTILTI